LGGIPDRSCLLATASVVAAGFLTVSAVIESPLLPSPSPFRHPLLILGVSEHGTLDCLHFLFVVVTVADGFLTLATARASMGVRTVVVVGAAWTAAITVIAARVVANVAMPYLMAYRSFL